MNLKIGSESFFNVAVPLLWGTRAIIQDKLGRITVVDLGGSSAKLEILADEPAEGIEFEFTSDGFLIRDGDKALYNYSSVDKTLRSASLNLPQIVISPGSIMVGTNTFSNNTIIGSEVGLLISERGIGIGASLPYNLARLVI
jgi:hypothetical protein